MVAKLAARSCGYAAFLIFLLLLSAHSAVHSATCLPWENPDSVQSALLKPDGQSVLCSGVAVDRIAARNNPAFFVITDPLSSTEAHNRIIVLSRPPLSLRHGQSMDVQGTIGTLPSGERCILNPTVEGYFDNAGRPRYWMPIPSFLNNVSKQVPACAILPRSPL